MVVRFVDNQGLVWQRDESDMPALVNEIARAKLAKRGLTLTIPFCPESWVLGWAEFIEGYEFTLTSIGRRTSGFFAEYVQTRFYHSLLRIPLESEDLCIMSDALLSILEDRSDLINWVLSLHTWVHALCDEYAYENYGVPLSKLGGMAL